MTRCLHFGFVGERGVTSGAEAPNNRRVFGTTEVVPSRKQFTTEMDQGDGRKEWCPEEDSNLHDREATSS